VIFRYLPETYQKVQKRKAPEEEESAAPMAIGFQVLAEGL
jgi:hypothetical protein